MEAEPASEAEDKRILQVARELCQQLNLENLYPERVSWQEQYSRRGRLSQDKYGNPIGPYVTPHFPLFYHRTLILRPIIRGRLVTEDWRPLLASSIIFYGQLRPKVNRRSTLGVAPTLALSAVLLLGLLLRNSIFNELSIVFTLTALIIVTAAAGAYGALMASRKSMLIADKKAAELVGPQALLDALRKIQSLKQSDERQDKMSSWAWTEYGDAPSIEKRIKNLQSLSGSLPS
jgi:hypothetical protein